MSRPVEDSVVARFVDRSAEKGPAAEDQGALRPGPSRYAEFESKIVGVETEIFDSQIPGGMISNMESQLRQQNAGHRLKEVCRSPIAGVVRRVSAQVGQAIQANDVLLVLEAMKMETVITSPVAGKVARVNATVGDAVQSGQVLVEFE